MSFEIQYRTMSLYNDNQNMTNVPVAIVDNLFEMNRLIYSYRSGGHGFSLFLLPYDVADDARKKISLLEAHREVEAKVQKNLDMAKIKAGLLSPFALFDLGIAAFRTIDAKGMSDLPPNLVTLKYCKLEEYRSNGFSGERLVGSIEKSVFVNSPSV